MDNLLESLLTDASFEVNRLEAELALLKHPAKGSAVEVADHMVAQVQNRVVLEHQLMLPAVEETTVRHVLPQTLHEKPVVSEPCSGVLLLVRELDYLLAVDSLLFAEDFIALLV